jgi:hypothetical protein
MLQNATRSEQQNAIDRRVAGDTDEQAAKAAGFCRKHRKKVECKMESQNWEVVILALCFLLVGSSGFCPAVFISPRCGYENGGKRGTNQIPGALPLAMILCPFGATIRGLSTKTSAKSAQERFNCAPFDAFGCGDY